MKHTKNIVLAGLIIIFISNVSQAFAAGGLIKALIELGQIATKNSDVTVKSLDEMALIKTNPYVNAYVFEPSSIKIESRNSLEESFSKLGINQNEYFGIKLKGSCFKHELQNSIESKANELGEIMESIPKGGLPDYLIKKKFESIVNESIKGITELSQFSKRIMKLIPIKVDLSVSEANVSISLPCGQSLSFSGLVLYAHEDSLGAAKKISLETNALVVVILGGQKETEVSRSELKVWFSMDYLEWKKSRRRVLLDSNSNLFTAKEMQFLYQDSREQLKFTINGDFPTDFYKISMWSNGRPLGTEFTVKGTEFLYVNLLFDNNSEVLKKILDKYYAQRVYGN